MSATIDTVVHDAVVELRDRPPADTPRLAITTVLVVVAGPAGVAVRTLRRGLA